jgi:microcompartment protein CcmL/EutN
MNDAPAIGVIEMKSIARGYVALDAACKRAPVRVVRAEPITPGKYWFVIAGGEAEVDESIAAAVEIASDTRIDHTVLPAAHVALREVLGGATIGPVEMDAVGSLELASIAATVRATDAALKAAAVSLVDLHLARGIGGKGFVIVTGELSDVEAAIAAGADAAAESWIVGREVIPNPDSATSFAAWTRGTR